MLKVCLFLIVLSFADSKSVVITFDKLDQLLSKHSQICGRVLNVVESVPISETESTLNSTSHIPSNSSDLVGRIVGGTDALPGQFPWQISIRRWSVAQSRWYHSCGGSIIDFQWILTAAHCTINKNISDYVVRIGEYDYLKTEGNEIDFNVSKIISHSSFTMQTIDSDIALIKLSQPIDLGANSPYIPVCIARDTLLAESSSNGSDTNVNDDSDNIIIINDADDLTDGNLNSTESNSTTTASPAASATISYQPPDLAIIYPEKNCYSTGWGRIGHKGKFPAILQKVHLNLIEQKSCRKVYEEVNPITDGMLCSGRSGKGTCQGDSGGPLQCLETDNGNDEQDPKNIRKRWTLFGLTSWAVGCAEPNYPSVSTRVAYYRNWIADRISENLV